MPKLRDSYNIEYKPIHYGDGHETTEFIFDGPVTEAEFIQYCKENGLPTESKSEVPWYKDYGIIQKVADYIWRHTHVMRYTD